jgi:hypothetical protein
MTTLIEKLRVRYAPIPDTGCWEWYGAFNNYGYGSIRVDGLRVGAHRASYVAHVGPLPSNMQVLHKCDNPSCVNPDHLFLGTQSDNVYDMVHKGRHIHGTTHPNYTGGRKPHSKAYMVAYALKNKARIAEYQRNRYQLKKESLL